MAGSETGVDQEIQRNHQRECRDSKQEAARSLHTLVEVAEVVKEVKEGRDLDSIAVLLEEEQCRLAE
jgi:ribosomal protein S5